MRRRTRHPGRKAARPEGVVRVELDLPHELLRPSVLPVLRQIEAFLREQEIEERGNFLRRAAELLDELGGLGFARVDHWEVEPGGWLPLPEGTHEGLYEPVGHLVRALRSPAWAHLALAQAFGVRLTSAQGRRADVRLRRLHREREHSITVDLWGPPGKEELRRIVGGLRDRFSPLKLRVRR